MWNKHFGVTLTEGLMGEHVEAVGFISTHPQGRQIVQDNSDTATLNVSPTCVLHDSHIGNSLQSLTHTCKSKCQKEMHPEWMQLRVPSELCSRASDWPCVCTVGLCSPFFPCLQ